MNPIHQNRRALGATDIVTRLTQLNGEAAEGWKLIDGALDKTFTFGNYHETMAFVNAVAWIAHREDHHPDLGVHYDASVPSRLEEILARDPLDNSNILSQARDGIDRLRLLDLSKYNIHDPALAPPAPGYVLVVDQTLNDASIGYGMADADSFRAMLAAAKWMLPVPEPSHTRISP